MRPLGDQRFQPKVVDSDSQCGAGVTVEMYEEAEPVRVRIPAGSGNRQTDETPSQTHSDHQSWANHGNAVSDCREGELETSPDVYIEALVVNLQLPSQGARLRQAGPEGESNELEAVVDDRNIAQADPSAEDRTYRAGPSDRRRPCSLARSHRRCMAAAFVVMLSLVAVGLTLTILIKKEKISQLSANIGALKRNLNHERNRTAVFLDQRLNDVNKTPLSQISSNSSCPEGYSKWRGTCYKAFNTSKTFWHADMTCRHAGSTGSLAMPRDAETNAFLISLYRSVHNRSSFWFGLHDQFEEGSYEWMDGTPLGEYNLWAPGQPNDKGGIEDCVCFSQCSPDVWYDTSCIQRLPFLCQVGP